MIYSDLKDDINAFLSQNAIWLAAALVTLILLAIFLFVFLNMKRNGKLKHDNKISTNSDEWQIAIGGKNNIKSVNAMGSRLTLELNDSNLINKDKLKELGVSNILVMSEKIILVVEDNAEKVKERLLK